MTRYHKTADADQLLGYHKLFAGVALSGRKEKHSLNLRRNREKEILCFQPV